MLSHETGREVDTCGQDWEVNQANSVCVCVCHLCVYLFTSVYVFFANNGCVCGVIFSKKMTEQSFPYSERTSDLTKKGQDGN